jgi:hypothetical protein
MADNRGWYVSIAGVLRKAAGMGLNVRYIPLAECPPHQISDLKRIVAGRRASAAVVFSIGPIIFTAYDDPRFEQKFAFLSWDRVNARWDTPKGLGLKILNQIKEG